MPDRPAVCVFCGSSAGENPRYADAARSVGRELARNRIDLVYGGGDVGLMGIVADAALQAGGYVVGIIPESLARREIAHEGLSELHVVPGMHERKAMMAIRSNAFLTLPGGIGTFEEFFEIATWAVLGIHRKPIGILNVDGYFDPLLAMLEHAVTEKFLRRAHLDSIQVGTDPEAIVASLISVQAGPSPEP